MNMNLLRKLSLNLRMVLLTILIGIIVFVGTEFVVVRQIERSFTNQIEEALKQQSLDGRSRFDHFVKAHYQLAKIIVAQESFQKYAQSMLAEGGADAESRRQPSWLPKSSVLRVMAHADFYLLYDEAGSLLDYYQTGVEPLPEELRNPDSHLLAASHNENFFSTISDKPYILSAESVSLASHKNVVLLLATPVDDHLLLHLLPLSVGEQIVAISTGFDPYVISSSNLAAVPRKERLEDLRSRYLVAGETVFNYEYSDLLITYNHLMPLEDVRELTAPVIKRQRLQLLIIAAVFVAIFSLLVSRISRRIQGVTKDVVSFSEEVLDKPAGELQGRDEIDTLKEQFEFLTREVIAASKEQAAFLETILAAMPTPIYYTDREGTCLGCNGAYAKIVGSIPEDIVGKSVFEFVPEQMVSPLRLMGEVLFASGGKKHIQVEYADAAGVRRNVVLHLSAYYRGETVPAGLVGALVDISDIQRAKDDLAEANAFLRSLVHSILDLIFYKDTQRVYLGCNKAFELFVGKPASQIVGATDLDLFPREVAEVFRDKDQRMLDTGRPQSNEEWVDFPDGRRVLLDTLKTPFYGPDGLVRGLIGISRDITARFRAEQERRSDYERFKMVLDSFDSLIYVADMDTYELLFVNKFGRDIWGDIAGQICWQALQKDQPGPCPFCTNPQLLDSSGKPAGVIVWEFQNTLTGDWFECRDQAIPWTDGRLVRLEIATNINVRKHAAEEQARMENQLRQAQKMEAIGTLAGGIAHDFNNILAAIFGFTELAQFREQGDARIREDLDNVLQAGKRARDLVKQILAFSRQSEHEKQPIQVGLIVKEALKLIRASISTNIDIKQDIDSGCGPVFADPVQIHQVVMNLCTNAYHAMRKNGGTLSVSLRPFEEAVAEASAGLPSSGRYIELIVADTGVGMDKIVLDRILEPYFTTKEKGEGTGLGLSLVHGIITGLGGQIRFESESGRGTSVRILLPEMHKEASSAGKQEQSAVPGGTERLLIVDDERKVAEALERILASLGYTSSVFTSSEDAFRAFVAAPKDYDLVITDMAMPGMTGVDLTKKMLSVRPGMPIIMCTGYSDIFDDEAARRIGISRYIMKPVLKGELALAIRGVLDSRE